MSESYQTANVNDRIEKASMPRLMPLLFSATIFLGSALLFLIQPMFAKGLLPLAGGTPTVWNTCVFFFQGMLLAGYALGLVITTRLRHSQQTIVHVLLLIGGLGATTLLFVRVAPPPAGQGSYLIFVLQYLATTVGWAVLLLSATGIVLQRWFATAGADPYHLYSASNAGSFIALVIYPFVFEPAFTITRQKQIWAGLFVLFVLSMMACAWSTWGNQDIPGVRGDANGAERGSDAESELPGLQKIKWVFLAFVPSSLMLGVTTYVTTDVAPAPLFWIIPLSVYLLAFTLAFAKRQLIGTIYLVKLLPGAAILLTLTYAAKATEPAWLLIIVHLLFFAITALLAHQLLADDRPSVRHLPQFYLLIAAGGLLGGLFNAVLAPMLFATLTEYPLTIVLSCLLLPLEIGDSREQYRSFAYGAGIAVLVGVLSWVGAGLQIGMMGKVAFVFAVPLLLINHLMTSNPLRLALGLGAVLLGSIFFTPEISKTLFADRNFFSPLKVTLDRDKTTRSLYHGTTMHGKQSITPGMQCVPLAYFHPTGPIGRVFEAHFASGASPNVAVIGLGTGAMMAYSRRGQNWAFYEINPLVIKLARDTGYFTYLHLCSRAPFVIIEGDARNTLTTAPDKSYGLVIMDAFNSDAIPVHLVTQEALDLYLSKLADGGMIAIHISNRHLDMHSVLANLAASRGLQCLGNDDTEDNPKIHKEPSSWIVVARKQEDFGLLGNDPNWKPVHRRPGERVWTDEYSNILQALR